MVVFLSAAVAAGCQRGDSSSGDEQRDETEEHATKRAEEPLLPGAEPFPVKLQERLWDEVEARGDYEPRTRHLEADGSPTYVNRLILEPSPYLQQHAHNPVNWYPWGEEAFAAAKRLGRPILLSVGYSTCHWCHVMEEESFEDPEIARYLNAHYIPVKVDREERPDVDSIYMKAVRALTGGGGWPMTVWLTPDGEPFFAGTYFPPRNRGGRPGFLDVLERLKKTWEENPDKPRSSARSLVTLLENRAQPRGGAGVDEAKVLQAAAAHYERGFDDERGGLDVGPRGNKFPSSLPVRFLLRYARRTGEETYRDMAVLTLEKMAAGGIRDHIGGGFHRYSTDPRWLVPHFEKMLYDNARLAVAYLEGYQASGNRELARVAQDTLTYLLRNMAAPEGGFYSATDADSPTPHGETEEGWYFTWTPREIDEVLGADEGRVVRAYYGVTDEGNFEGRTILHESRSFEEVADELEMDTEDVMRIVDQARRPLREAREKRPRPHRDDKILAGWNGLMLSALARASLALAPLDDAAGIYSDRAEELGEFLLTKMRRDGRLARHYKDGAAHGTGFLPDYAFVIAGLLDLFETTGDRRWLDEAIALDDVLAEHFEDTRGGFYLTPDDHEALLVREKPGDDGAMPSGNSVMALNLVRLEALTLDDGYRKRADKLVAAFSETLSHRPHAMSQILLALDFRTDVPKEVVLVAPEHALQLQQLRRAYGATFVPNGVLVPTVEGEPLDALVEHIPYVEKKVARRDRPTAYVCERQRCEAPTSEPETLARQLAKTRPLFEGKKKKK